MRRSVLPLASLALLAELILLSFRHEASPWHVAFHAVVLLAALVVGLRMRAVAPRAAILAVAAATAGLLTLDTATLARGANSATLEEISQESLENEALTAASAFEAFFAAQRDLVAALPEDFLSPTLSREDLFERLARFRDERSPGRSVVDLTIYDAGGEALAWVGETSVLETLRTSLAARAGTQFTRREPLGTRLYTARTGTAIPGSRFAVAEALLDAPYAPESWRRRVDLPASLTASLHVEFLDPAQADASLNDFLASSGDLYWKRGGGVSQLLTGLHGKTGELLGLLTLSPESPPEAAARAAKRTAGARLLLLLPALAVLAAAAAAWRREHGPGVGTIAALAGAVLAGRLALRGLLPWLQDLPLFDFRLFASPAPLRLAASPGDLLATCLVVLALVALGVSLLRNAGAIGRFACFGLAAIAVPALWRITPEWINDSSLNPLLSPFSAPIAPRLALLTAHTALVFAVGILLWAAAAPRRPGSARDLTLLWLAAASVSFLVLAREAGRVPPVLIESSLAPEVRRSREEARDRVSEVLSDVRDDPRWDLVHGATPEALTRLTFEAWRASALGQTGAHSALALIDPSGRVLGSFAYGLPERIFADADSARGEPPDIGTEPDAAPVLTEDALRVLRLNIPLLRGDIALFHEGRFVGRIAVLLSREWDNLPFLTLRDPLLATLGAGSREPDFDEYFGGAPLFLAYSTSGEVLFPSAERAAPLSPTQLAAGRPSWGTTLFEGHDYRTHLFQTPEGPRALGYAAPSALSVAAGLIRTLCASLIALVPILVIYLLLTVPDLSLASALASGGGFLAGSYYRRLLTVVLASSLVPLLLLAVIFRNSIERQSRDAFEREGVSASATIGRLLEDYAATAEASGASGEPIESRTLYWIGRTVHQDVHLFTSEQLVATSRGDPEASGLRTFRLNAEVARTLARSRPPQFLANEPSPGRATLIYALVRLEENAPKGVLAVPLVLQERVLTRVAEKVADALIAATFGLGIILSGIGYLFARRLSVPIRELSGAAATIAGGRFDVRVRPRGRDEIRRLVDAFNGMAGAIADQREDLRRRRDYIEAILLNVTTGVISTDAEGTVRTSNPAASLILDLPVDLIGRRLFDELEGRADLAPLRAHWSEPVREGSAGVPREISVLREGEELRLRSVALPLRESEASGPGRIFLVEDVTDVTRSHRLEAWAEMARGIAHEIKNPLTPIQLSAEHLLRVRGQGPAGTDDPVLRQCVDTILTQVRTLREISSDFSTYARLPVLRKEPVNLVEMVRATLAPYRASSPPGVEISVETAPLPPIELDERVLRRALVNLVENAMQAMEGGGRLSVSVRRVDGPGGSWAEIVVADTGVGMDDATRARVFEPYFSTRDSGVGLGLAITRRAVEEHGGTISAESAPGRGTRMIVRLPVSGRAETGHGDGPPSPASAPAASRVPGEPGIPGSKD